MDEFHDHCRANTVWLLYFVLIFCFYTVTVVQYAAFALIAAYTLFYIIGRGGVVDTLDFRRVRFTSLGYILLTIWAMLSTTWAYGVVSGSTTLVGMIKIAFIIFCLSLTCNEKEKAESIVLSYLYALAFMCVVILVTSPLSTYGTTSFGGITNQFRNTIANASFFAVLFAWYMQPKISRNRFFLICVIFLVTGLCTGSRRGIVQLFLLLIIFALTQKDINSKIRWILLGVLAVGVLYVVLSYVPFFQNTYADRLLSIFDYSTEMDDGSDASTVGRNLYRMIGMIMFRQKPIMGYGVDGFTAYLADHPYTYSSTYLNAVYSHCNFVELLADFGIVGFIMYYTMHFSMLKYGMRNFKYNRLGRMILIFVLVTLVTDYGGISYQSTFSIYTYVLFLLLIFLDDSEELYDVEGNENWNCNSASN